MNTLKVSGVAKGQYKQVCPLSWGKCEGNENTLTYKIRRAIDLGKVTHTYTNGCKIIRYYHLNFLVSEDEVMTMWLDTTREPYQINEKTKQLHEDLFFHKKFSAQELSKLLMTLV